MQVNLQRIPFFSALPNNALQSIGAKLRLERYAKDDIVFAQGEEGEALYLIESGQVKVVVQDGNEERILSFLGPGSFFGEMALLTGERRSATVQVSIDAELWVLHKDDWDHLLREQPTIALVLSQELSRRLSATDRQPTRRQEHNIVAVVGAGVGHLAASLARQMDEQVLIFDLGGMKLSDEEEAELHRNEVAVLDSQTSTYLRRGGLAETLSSMVEKFDRVLLSVAPDKFQIANKAMDLAQATVLIDVPDAPRYRQASGGQVWTTTAHPADLDRMARRIAGRLVGVALSSGGARGLAHIGVLRVLEEEDVPIDMMAGTSAGSLFGGLYAAGMSADEVARFAIEMPKRIRVRNGLWDFHLPPRSGLIKGQRMVDFLNKVLNGATFADLRIPFFVVAADVLTGEEVIFQEGPLAAAIRASTSMVGIFSPAAVNGRYLIDGGAVNPVPCSVLADRGAELIIASSVIAPLREQTERRRNGQGMPNFLGVVSNMMSLMEAEIIKTRMTPADVLIQPDIARYDTMDFGKAEELIRLGEEAARREMDKIRHLLNAGGKSDA